MPTRRRALQSAACALAAGVFPARAMPGHGGEPEGTAAASPDPAAATLRGRAAARGLLFGAEVLAADLAADADYAALVARECGVLTPGLEAKWAATEPADGAFRLDGLDAVAAFAQAHGIALHGHTLVWAVYNPPWLLDALREGRGDAVLARHVEAVCGRHAGRVLAWDVVNEPVDPRWPADPQGLCTTNWWHALGPDYVERALRLAHAADPHALLLINDDDLEYDAPDRTLKRTQYLRLAEALLRRGAPLHGFGLEAHLKPDRRIAEREYRRFLAELAGMGLALFVTELDVTDQALPADIAARDALVADAARRYLDLVLDEPAVRAVQCWGLSHRHEQMGRDPATRRADGLPNRALPFDAALELTPMGEAIGRCLDAAPQRQQQARLGSAQTRKGSEDPLIP